MLLPAVDEAMTVFFALISRWLGLRAPIKNSVVQRYNGNVWPLFRSFQVWLWQDRGLEEDIAETGAKKLEEADIGKKLRIHIWFQIKKMWS